MQDHPSKQRSCLIFVAQWMSVCHMYTAVNTTIDDNEN